MSYYLYLSHNNVTSLVLKISLTTLDLYHLKAYMLNSLKRNALKSKIIKQLTKPSRVRDHQDHITYSHHMRTGVELPTKFETDKSFLISDLFSTRGSFL